MDTKCIIMEKKCHVITCTVNPLYNDIRYNSKIRYNVNSVGKKIRGTCIFSLTVPFYSLGIHTFLDILLESPG